MPKLKSKIYVIGTGGSISGIGPHRLDYTQYAEIGNKLTIEESLQRIPEVEEFADIQSENLISVGSTAIGPKEWLQLGHRVNEILSSGDIDGVVIIPNEIIDEVITDSENFINTESALRKDILSGVDPKDAYLKYRLF